MKKVIIIGGGHNGLVCAAYLARSGFDVTVLERHHSVGGATVTEEFYPGFRNSVASYTVSLLHPKIIQELNLYQHGLEILTRPVNNFLPLPDGDGLLIYPDLARTQRELARFSARDAARLPDYYQMLESVAELVRKLLLQTPPVLSNGGLGDIIKGIQLGSHLNKLSLSQRRSLLNLFTRSAGEILDSWFESDAIKSALGFDSVVGNFASPYSAGSAYLLLHLVLGEINGVKGAWGHAVGGMGAISGAIQDFALAKGVRIVTQAQVSQVCVSNNQVTGVVLEDGRDFRADIISSSVNPKILFLELLDQSCLEPAVLDHFRMYKCSSGTFRMNVALSELPQFSAMPNSQSSMSDTATAPYHQAGIIMAPSLAYMDDAFMEAKQAGWSTRPIVEMLIPSTIDDSLAPEGQHVASLFCQHFDPDMSESWDDKRSLVADLIIDSVSRFARGFSDSVLATQVFSPLDLERRFGLTGGDIYHGRLSLDQLFAARPILGHGDYRSPIKGLYMCGAGTHPGGGVSGIPGHNAAGEIIRDMKLFRI